MLIHNKNEEIEHAMMGLEWIRRNSPKFDENARTYLFTEGPIAEIEATEKMSNGEGKADKAEGKLDKLDKLEAKAEKAEGKLDKLEPKLDKLGPKIDKLEPKLDEIRSSQGWGGSLES